MGWAIPCVLGSLADNATPLPRLKRCWMAITLPTSWLTEATIAMHSWLLFLNITLYPLFRRGATASSPATTTTIYTANVIWSSAFSTKLSTIVDCFHASTNWLRVILAFSTLSLHSFGYPDLSTQPSVGGYFFRPRLIRLRLARRIPPKTNEVGEAVIAPDPGGAGTNARSSGVLARRRASSSQILSSPRFILHW